MSNFGKIPIISGLLSPIISVGVYICTSRVIILMFSTTFSILVIMLLLGILSVDELATILHLSPKSTMVLNKIVVNMKEVCGNLMAIVSQMLNKLLSSFGMNADLSKIHIDINHASEIVSGSKKDAN